MESPIGARVAHQPADASTSREENTMKVFHAVAAVALILSPVIGQAQSSSAKLDDPAIVGIFDAANTWDIATGALAASKATRSDVRAFGQMLARDHEGVRQQGRDLAKKLGVTPTPVAKTFALQVNHDEAMKKLNSLSGAAFDRAFLEHEVAFHKAVIDAATTTLAPAISNAEVKAFVLKVAPAFKAHMDAAAELMKKG
jgi:putative membrane protein